MSIHLILPDSHASPDKSNDRATWVGKLILDVKPDVFINLGDQWDLSSLSSYDKGKASFHGKSYRRDLDSGLDFSEKLWEPIRRAKKKKPYAVFCEGNHEERQRRVLEQHSELEDTISFNDFDLKRDYDEIVRYKGGTPGTTEVDGIRYGHFFITGVSGRNISGEHAAYGLLTKNFQSSTCGHIHTFDYSVRTDANGRKLHGLVAGCYLDYELEWAGEINKLWSNGVVIKRNVDQGNYDIEFVSIEQLRKEYSDG